MYRCYLTDCDETMFQCANGRCVSMALFCDFVDNCGDNSDEQRCGGYNH